MPGVPRTLFWSYYYTTPSTPCPIHANPWAMFNAKSVFILHAITHTLIITALELASLYKRRHHHHHCPGHTTVSAMLHCFCHAPTTSPETTVIIIPETGDVDVDGALDWESGNAPYPQLKGAALYSAECQLRTALQVRGMACVRHPWTLSTRDTKTPNNLDSDSLCVCSCVCVFRDFIFPMGIYFRPYGWKMSSAVCPASSTC